MFEQGKLFTISLLLTMIMLALPANGQVSFGAVLDYALDKAPFRAATGDLNGDGKPDLVARVDRGLVPERVSGREYGV
jgi:hypothetical protein